jgi:hypothetical protein
LCIFQLREAEGIAALDPSEQVHGKARENAKMGTDQLASAVQAAKTKLISATRRLRVNSERLGSAAVEQTREAAETVEQKTRGHRENAKDLGLAVMQVPTNEKIDVATNWASVAAGRWGPGLLIRFGARWGIRRVGKVAVKKLGEAGGQKGLVRSTWAFAKSVKNNYAHIKAGKPQAPEGPSV